jgi:hypothetical protein
MRATMFGVVRQGASPWNAEQNKLLYKVPAEIPEMPLIEFFSEFPEFLS